MTKEMNIYCKINKVRTDFTELKIKKSGENKFQGFKYLELKDFIPDVMKLNEKHGLISLISIAPKSNPNRATMEVINADNPEEKVIFETLLPIVGAPDKDGIFPPTNQVIQSIGAMETYMRRYLYMLYLEIAVDDEIDNKNIKTNKPRPKRGSK